MRKPFVSKGFEVTEDNMDAIARWCKGSVVRENVSRPFVRVPVSRATNEKQTHAYAGTVVVVSVFGKVRSYKVYKREWLEESFIELTDGFVKLAEAFAAMATEGINEEDDELDEDDPDEDILNNQTIESEEKPCCHHSHPSDNVLPLTTTPAAPKPRPRGLFRPPAQTTK